MYGLAAHVSANANIVFTGDSLTAGDEWPTAFLAEQITPPPEHNVAVGGKTIAALTTDDLTNVDPLFDSSKLNVLFVWAGTNDLHSGATAAATEAAIQAYCEARLALGWKVILGTITPRSNAGTPGSFEADRTTINTWLRANFLNFSHGLADVGGTGALGSANAQTDTNLYWDLCHMTTLGCTMAARVFSVAYANLLATL